MYFLFQAEDGIRDYKVTGVQTCALPIWGGPQGSAASRLKAHPTTRTEGDAPELELISAVRSAGEYRQARLLRDRKSTRLNSSHLVISYAVFCLKKKKTASKLILSTSSLL